MHIVAARELPRIPVDIAAVPQGDVLVLSWAKDGLHLDSYDSEFASAWHRELGDNALGLSVDQSGVPWVLDRRGVSALTGRGDPWHRIDFNPPDGMEVAAFTEFDDDVCFACQHRAGAEAREPLLARVARDGTVRWQSSPTSEAPGWKPKDWVNGYLGAGTLEVSGDALFAAYTDMPSSGFGLGYVLDVADGTLRYTVGTTAHDEATGMGNGAFLVGCGGQTALYGKDGRTFARWKTAGIHVVRGEDIRVLEMDNSVPTTSRIARLMPDGSVIHGDLIDGLQTSRPYVVDDRSFIFVRNSMLTEVHDLAIVGRQFVHRQHTDDVMSTRVLPVSDGIVTTYSRLFRDCGGEDARPLRHASGLVRVIFDGALPRRLAMLPIGGSPWRLE